MHKNSIVENLLDFKAMTPEGRRAHENFLNNPTEGTVMQSPGGGPQFEYKNGKFFSTLDGKYREVSLRELSGVLGLTNYVSIGGQQPTYNTDYYTE